MPTPDFSTPGTPCWVDLYTSDPDGAIDFYGQVFGWSAEKLGEDYGGYINFARGDQTVGGAMKNDGEEGPDSWNVYLQANDAEAATQAAPGSGGEVIYPAMDVMDLGRMAILTDAGGAGIGVWQPKEFRGFEVVGDGGQFEAGAPCWFELHTRKYEESIKFYQDVFKWDAVTASDEPGFRYTTLGKDPEAGIMDASGMLAEGDRASWSIYFGAADLDATLAKIEELGGSVVLPPDDSPFGRLAQAADPTGALFKLVQPNPNAE